MGDFAARLTQSAGGVNARLPAVSRLISLTRG
jgi:hypothetical protein